MILGFFNSYIYDVLFNLAYVFVIVGKSSQAQLLSW